MRHGYINQYASVYASSHGVRIYDQATEDTLKAEFRSHFRYKCWAFFGLPYFHMVIDEDNKIVAFSD